MTSSQINFYMMPEDVAELEQYIRQQGLVMIADKMPEDKIEFVNSLWEENRLISFISEKNFFPQIKIKYSESQPVFWVDPKESYVIQFRKPVLDVRENTLKPGRMYFDKQCFSEKGEVVSKDEKFLKLAENLFKWFKKNLGKVKVKGDPATESVMKWIEIQNGRII